MVLLHTNINMMGGEKIRLADVAFIDEAFVERFQRGELVSGEKLCGESAFRII